MENKQSRIIKHMSCNIKGMLRNYKNLSMDGLITDESGREMSDAEARKFLAECLSKGWKKIPCGDCEGFDHFEIGCPGHPILDEEIRQAEIDFVEKNFTNN